MFINTFRYRPEDVDCRLCTAYARKTGFKKAHCPYLAERMEAGSVGYTEALLESFPANSPFRWRLRLLADRFDGTLWHNEKHLRRMETQKAVCGYSREKNTPEYYAAMYLLTSDTDIYRRSMQCFSRTGMGFSRIRLRGASSHAYTVIAAAKSIYTGSGQITDADLANPEIVGIEAFTLIIHALLIVRYGLDALKITAKKADPSVFT